MTAGAMDRGELVTGSRDRALARRPAANGSWRVFPCEGGWYWESFRDGVKVNGGLAPDWLSADRLGRAHMSCRPRGRSC